MEVLLLAHAMTTHVPLPTGSLQDPGKFLHTKYVTQCYLLISFSRDVI
jgi:hypothetical protein